MKKQPLTILLYLTINVILTSCNRLNSLTTIQPGKQFELGGNRNGAFIARLKNVGNVPVTISERLADGKYVTLDTFKPGDSQTVRFSSGSAALLDNVSAKPAQLHLVVTGDTNLSMRELTN